ncbi:MAG: bifunctional phosphoribosylaminoimidazolecarboxamide formyltransferase/IMP cyclohydrolase [Deltaproteobacteria bacterium]|nr:bifunctional phosphoribosylaminoimidazolecarboxamide formyltransferase/IMP cyclohydrolase [Deltaproteobacteria bacterium]
MQDTPIRRAILSVWDKTGIVELAQDLANRGVEILSTGGTLRTLTAAGIPVTSVADFTGHPEIFAGRVKTLHPKLEGAILYRRHDQADEAGELGIPPIDLVVVNLYPFEAVTADPSCDLAKALEHIDIGGPTMIRAAAKNHTAVTVVIEPAQYGMLRVELEDNDGSVTGATRASLARHAFARVSGYDATIAAWLQPEDAPFPARLSVPMSKIQDMRYGENPHQRAAFYGELGWSGPSLAKAKQLHGKALSYNNINDADSALRIVLEFTEPTAVIIKHANPSGVASADELITAYDHALACDPISAFGGILAINRPFTLELAERIGKHFFEVILAPAFEEDAAAKMMRKKNLRLLVVPEMSEPRSGAHYVARVMGGYLVSDWDEGGPEERRVVSERAPTDEEHASMDFAWKVAKHVKSNAILLVKGTRTIGVGAGQMSRVDASELAVLKASKAGIDTTGCVLASDAFFPFRDGLDAAAKSGCCAVIEPGGSIRDDEVIGAANEHGLAMVFTGTRHFRH